MLMKSRGNTTVNILIWEDKKSQTTTIYLLGNKNYYKIHNKK